MSDITMCPGTGCPIKESCHRFMAKADNHYQSWFAEVPGNWYDDIHINNKQLRSGEIRTFKCEMYWGNQNESIMNTLNEILK